MTNAERLERMRELTARIAEHNVAASEAYYHRRAIAMSALRAGCEMSEVADACKMHISSVRALYSTAQYVRPRPRREQRNRNT